MASMNHDHVMNDINVTLGRAAPPITDECCIYKTPYNIRRLNEDAYTPKFVSIGPFHHSNSRVQNMQRHKLRYCKKFLERAESCSNVRLDALVRHIEDDEPKVRCCYSETLDLTPEELVKVVLVDSCSIFELFWRGYHGGDDTLFMKPWLNDGILTDLLLLENQLPFFALNTLFTSAFRSLIAAGRVPSFLKLTFHYFGHFNICRLPFSDDVEISHFTDLLRFFHLKPFETLVPPLKKGRTEATDVSKINLKSATGLSEAGVAFKVNKRSKCLLDLTFSGKVLEIPHLIVDENIEILFRNLIALEQCHYPYESYFTDYVTFLDFLINTSKDVDVLVDKGILVNWLGDSDSVAKLFNSIARDIINANFGKHHFELCGHLDAFCRDACHNLKATLRRDYGSTPWQAAASIAGIVLLVLTLIQTACSLIQVAQQ